MSYPNNVEPMQMDASMDDVDVYETSDSSNSDNLNYQVETAPFEIETYASQFHGYNKLLRLIYIADHCPPLKVDALEHALKYVKESTYDGNMYLKIQHKLYSALAGAGEPYTLSPIDHIWIEERNNLSQMVFDKLETDLKNYKTNSIKESIRRGHDDLGAHYLLCGDLNNALKCYTRSKDYCMGDHHIFNICLNVITLNVYLQNWANVSSYVQKAESSAEYSSNAECRTKINCLAGLNEMICKRYKSAAERFVKAQFDEIGHHFADIISTNNVAIYGGLCALASFDRDELRRKVLQSPTFRLFLELEPQLREAINRFLESKYPDCLKLLDELKDAFLLDLYLAPHVKPLYALIRSRALIQYFTPYLSANLNTMASAFNTDVSALEDELERLILDGQIEARIDSYNKILYAKDNDPRLLTFDLVLEKGKDWQMKTTAMILRTAVARNGLITVKQFSQQPQSSNTSSTTAMANNQSSSTTTASTQQATTMMNSNNVCEPLSPLIPQKLQMQQQEVPLSPCSQLLGNSSPSSPSPPTPPLSTATMSENTAGSKDVNPFKH